MFSKICCTGTRSFGLRAVCTGWTLLLGTSVASVMGTVYVVADEPDRIQSPLTAQPQQAVVTYHPNDLAPQIANSVGYSIDLGPVAGGQISIPQRPQFSAPQFSAPQSSQGYENGQMVPPGLTAVLRHHCYGNCSLAKDETVCSACASGQHEKCRHRRGHVCCLGRVWEKHKPRFQYTHLGYPENFVERQLGASIDATLSSQIRNGMQDQSVLYDYDFLPAPQHDQLSPAGKQRLRRIVINAERWQLPILVNQSPEGAQLAGQRRTQVIQTLVEWEALIDPGMVLVGVSNESGLRGVDALLIRARETQLIQSGGTTASGSRLSTR